jgi:serine protease AprX
MFLSRTITALTLVVGFYSFTANAGHKLYFKKGLVDTSTKQSQLISRNSKETQYQIIQFKKNITVNDKNNLKDMGIEVLRYIPDDAYLVKVVSPSNRGLNLLPNLQFILPYVPEFKVSSEFGVIDHLSGERVEKILVQTFDEQVTNNLVNQIKDLGQIVFAKGKYLGVVGSLKLVEEISMIDGVEWIEPYPEIKLQNFELSKEIVDGVSRKTVTDLDGFESGTKVMNFDAAWGRGFTGKGQLVAFSDTGLDSGNIQSIHSDFKNQVQKGYAYGLLSFSWNDPMGHGTHVAGSVAGNASLSSGKTKGGAYGAKLIAGGMWSQILKNMIPPQDITKMFADAYKDGARVHTNSWGSAQNLGAYDSFAQTVDEYMWNNPEMLLMFAAGNSGTDDDNDGRVDEDSIGSPATAKNVLSVGASENLVTDGGIQRKIGDLKKQDGSPLFSTAPISEDFLSNNINGIAAFSSRGPTDDKRMKPDLVAPGTNILSTRSQVKDASVLWGALDQNYSWSGGTSMSTPLVAGGAAVLREYLISIGIHAPSAALVKGLLMHTATDLYPGQFGTEGKSKGQELLTNRPNPHQGFGRVNMDAATSKQNLIIIEDEVASGDFKSITVKDLSNFKVTMIYTDAPGAASSSKALVNNLDLRILEDGVEIARGSDKINNYEYIEIEGAEGAIIFEILGENIPTARPNGKLPFALIVTAL